MAATRDVPSSRSPTGAESRQRRVRRQLPRPTPSVANATLVREGGASPMGFRPCPRAWAWRGARRPRRSSHPALIGGDLHSTPIWVRRGTVASRSLRRSRLEGPVDSGPYQPTLLADWHYRANRLQGQNRSETAAGQRMAVGRYRAGSSSPFRSDVRLTSTTGLPPRTAQVMAGRRRPGPTGIRPPVFTFRPGEELRWDRWTAYRFSFP